MKRAAIQKELTGPLLDAVDAVAKKLGLDPNNPDHHRRMFRAVVGLAATQLLNQKAPPQLVLAEACRAVAEEVEGRANMAVALGNPFGLPPPANA
jgi:hypothetical protein